MKLRYSHSEHYHHSYGLLWHIHSCLKVYKIYPKCSNTHVWWSKVLISFTQLMYPNDSCTVYGLKPLSLTLKTHNLKICQTKFMNLKSLGSKHYPTSFFPDFPKQNIIAEFTIPWAFHVGKSNTMDTTRLLLMCSALCMPCPLPIDNIVPMISLLWLCIYSRGIFTCLRRSLNRGLQHYD